MNHDSPIAIFDSGLGGLTVARAIHALLPQEPLAYLGDTARLPYGSKSSATVHRFTHECLRFLMTLSPKLLVVACNTASALALDDLRDQFDVPLIGVLEPGARAAARLPALKTASAQRIGLIATEATIASNAYPLAVRRIDPAIHVVARACPLLVPLIEEGRTGEDPIVQMVLREYLAPFAELRVSGLILGCTHYPILGDAIAAALGPGVQLVDSAQQTALAVRDRLAKMDALAPAGAPRGTLTCYVTDQGQRFERLATRFLGQAVGQPIWVAPEMLESQASAL